MMTDVDKLGAGRGNITIGSRYNTLSGAQVDFPFATSLSQSMDWAAIQKAVLRGGKVQIGLKDYWLSDPVVIDGSKPVQIEGVDGKAGSRIVGLINDKPMFHRGVYITHDNQLVGSTNQGTGCAMIFRDVFLEAGGTYGCVAQLYNVSAPTGFYQCSIATNYRGVLVSQGFNTLFVNCAFAGSYDQPSATLTQARNAFLLAVSGHSSIVESSFQAGGCGIYAFGPQITIRGSRIEMCNRGIVAGGPTLAFELLEQEDGVFVGGSLDNVITESCIHSVYVHGNSKPSIRNLTITSNIDNHGRTGLHLARGSKAKIDGLIVSGKYQQVAARLDAQPFRSDDWAVGNTDPAGYEYSRPLAAVVNSAYLAGHTAFSQAPVVTGGSGAATSYTYASSVVTPDGAESVVGGPALATASAPNGATVTLNVYGLAAPGAIRRFYKRRSDSEHWLGYWETPISQSTFVDEGQAFDGEGYPLE